MLLYFAIAAGLGWFARGATLGSAEASPPVAAGAAIRRLPLPELHCPAAAAPPIEPSDSEPREADDGAAPTLEDGTGGDDTGGDDLGDLIAKANAATETHNGIHGHVSDTHTGEPVPGVTVLISGGGQVRSAYTNDLGDYELADLEAGTYAVSFYVGNLSSARPNITINSFDTAAVDERFDTRDMNRNEAEDVPEDE
ncbi:MAG: carboxypeptidase-like regulatory domain-containing protein [Kofleriaceae bacterium]